MITLSIDLLLLNKAKLKKLTRKNGAEACFLNLVLIETPTSEFGDYIVKQDSSKEEREAKTQMPILGNAKNIQRK